MDNQRNQFGGRFTNMTSQLQSDIYDAANSIAGGNVLINYSRLEGIIQQEIAKARINEGQMFREAMINHSTPAIYWGKRLDELSQTLKELEAEL